jgi:hypothetical protein
MASTTYLIEVMTDVVAAVVFNDKIVIVDEDGNSIGYRIVEVKN